MITKEQYNEWRNRPDTLFFRQFLKDRREAMIRDLTAAWLTTLDAFEAAKGEARGRILELEDMADVPFETVSIFYAKPDQEKDNASETAEHQEGRVHSSSILGQE